MITLSYKDTKSSTSYRSLKLWLPIIVKIPSDPVQKGLN